MKRAYHLIAITASLATLSAGCGDTAGSDMATPPDSSVPRDFTTPPDTAQPRDLSMADMAMAGDMAVPPDMAMAADMNVTVDGGPVLDMTLIDLAGQDGPAADLAASRDLAGAIDMAVIADMATPADMTTPPDLRGVDLATIPDLAQLVDLAMAPQLLLVAQVGDGVAQLSTASAKVTVRKFKSDGAEQIIDKFPLTLPVAANGAQQALTIAGSDGAEGSLSVSTDGRYATIAGYAAAPGTAAIATTASMATNRVVGRIDKLGNTDTSTRFNTAYDKVSIRAAATDDGTRFWAAGASPMDPTQGGAQYILQGITDPGLQVSATISDFRVVHIFTGQLYGTSGVANYNTVDTIGLGKPTFMNQMTRPAGTGLAVANTSPYSFVVFDTDGVGGIDLIYLADDRATNGGGGIQRWTFDGLNWKLDATLTGGLATGVRGLAGVYFNKVAYLYATTTEASANKLVSLTDFGNSPMAVTLATAPANTAFRGVCLAPTN